MDRRRFLLTSLAGAIGAPLPGAAQQVRRPNRIGFLFAGSQRTGLELVRQRLRSLGYVEGRDISIEVRVAEDKLDRLASLAAELVAARMDIIVATVTPAAQAAKQATSRIPIVFTAVSDPVASGLVKDLAHPGGNLTGLTTSAPDIAGKRLQLLKEMVPTIARVAVLWNAANPIILRQVRETEAAAPTLGVTLHVVGVRALQDFEDAFRDMAAARVGAVVVLADFLTFGHKGQLGDLAAKHRLPMISELEDFAKAGAIMAYGPSIPDLAARTGDYIDKILKGAKPADLPVERPTTFQFVLNMKTAKTLGISVPASLALRADRIIE